MMIDCDELIARGVLRKSCELQEKNLSEEREEGKKKQA